MRHLLVMLLSLCLALFLADAILSLADDSLILLGGIHILTSARGFVFLFALLMAIVVYVLMGVSPAIPKRLFLPVTLFSPVASLAVIAFLIYNFNRVQQAAWFISLFQLIVGLCILSKVQGGLKFRWPLVSEKQLLDRRFSWGNVGGFFAINVFVFLPAVVVYLFVCAALAVSHHSDGFLALTPRGLTVQVRKYVRADGKSVQLVPMAHVGDPEFYRKLTQSFPTNSLILMEGVSDHKNLLTNKISYKRMANSLGLAEQHHEFNPRESQVIPADVDVEVFSTNTIDFLNLAMLAHARGVNAETILKLTQYTPPPGFEERLFDDLLRKRNRRLLEEISAQLSQSDALIVPWGAAHMPEIAKEIQTSGFRLQETKEYSVIRFRGR